MHMRLDKKRLTSQRAALDARMRELGPLRSQTVPRAGWLRAVRESLGLTARQLARRLKVDSSNILRMEERETKGTVSLESLDKAARAMGCRLVYAIVPEGAASLEEIVDAQSLAFAKQLAGNVAHSMRLENQTVGEAERDAHVKALADDLKRRLDSRMWSVPT